MKTDGVKGPLRLNVYLAHQGIMSRRKAMEAVLAGRVSVNGRVVQEPSTPVKPGDKVEVNGKTVDQKTYQYVMLNKPEGIVTTREDRFAEKTVLDLLPPHLRHLNPVGRLDKNTEGLLILTNDGDLANRLSHPRYDVDKTYMVRIQKKLKPEERKQIESGFVLDKEKTAPAKVSDVRDLAHGCEFLLTIHEGRKRQIRLMLAKLGHYVTFLKRISQGPLVLGNLPSGKFRVLTESEIRNLRKE